MRNRTGKPAFPIKRWGCVATLGLAGLFPVQALAEAQPRLVASHGLNDRATVSGDGSVVVIARAAGNSLTAYNVKRGTRKTVRFRRFNFGNVRWPVTRNGRKVIYATPSKGDKFVADLMVTDLKTSTSTRYTGYTLSIGQASASGRYVPVFKRSNTASNPSGILDLQTRRFVPFPRAKRPFESFGASAISGAGDWSVYLEASNNNGSRCFSFSRVTRQSHPLGSCSQGGLAMSDDAHVATLGFNTFANARTGKQLPGLPGTEVFKRPPGVPSRPSDPSFDAVDVGMPLTADGSTTAVACRSGLYTVGLDTGIYSRISSLTGSIDHLLITSSGNALVYQRLGRTYEVGTLAGTPSEGLPADCIRTPASSTAA